MEMMKWNKTDDGQYLYKEDSNKFWVAQIRVWFDDYCVTVNYIDIDTYDMEDIVEILHYYDYDDITDLESYIVAECLAEEIDDFTADFKGTYEECEKWCEEVMKEYCKEVYKVVET